MSEFDPHIHTTFPGSTTSTSSSTSTNNHSKTFSFATARPTHGHTSSSFYSLGSFPVPTPTPVAKPVIDLTKPHRALLVPSDIDKFIGSSIYNEINSYIEISARAICGVKISQVTLGSTQEDQIIQMFINLMNKLYDLTSQAPPIAQPMRFGNKAFRTWTSLIVAPIEEFLKELWKFPHTKPRIVFKDNDNDEEYKDNNNIIDNQNNNNKYLNENEFVEEFKYYLIEMFGNSTRIDYGTGHELNFVIFFLGLFKINLLSFNNNELDKSIHNLQIITLLAFSNYIKVVRKIQKEYLLEPAGSHGVWGLDDYHCLTFLWGSSQLCTRNDIDDNDSTIEKYLPSSINNIDVLDAHKNDYLYFENIKFIHEIKKGAPFSETSPMLYDISSKPDWKIIYRGLKKLHTGEVMNKFPVVQHLLFNKVIASEWTLSL